MMQTILLLNHKVRDLSAKITHLSIKIMITPDYEGEKRHYNLNRFAKVAKKITATIFLTSRGYTPDCSSAHGCASMRGKYMLGGIEFLNTLFSLKRIL